MKAVILTTSTGQGHNSAARAVAAELEKLGYRTEILDVLGIGKPVASRRVSELYTGIVSHAPWFFGSLYRAGELVSSSRRRSPIYYLNTLYAHSLFERLTAAGPDIVICTHIFAAQAVTHLIVKGGLSVPTVGIMTDYTCSPFWEETRLGRYVIPSELLLNEFISKGIPREKLVPIGIPAGRQFSEKLPKKQARSLLGLRPGPVFAVMGGSMGCGSIRKLCAGIKRLKPDAQMLAVCGYNGELYRKLSGTMNGRAFRFTDKIGLILDASDVLITKPGGLSATEAAVKQIPTVFTDAIPGCETRNAAFFSSLGMALSVSSPFRAAQMAVSLAADKEKAEEMAARQRKQINPYAARDIARLIQAVVS